MLSLTDVEARKLDAENEREMRISNGNNDRDEDDIHDNSWNGKMTETDGMISFSMMILLLYLPLPLRYKWAIWSEEEVQISIQQKCFSVFFSFRRWWAPLFLCVSRSPPPFSSRFKFHLLCGTAALSCVYSIHDVIVGISSTKGTKDRQLAILSVLYFFLSFRLRIDFTFVDTKKISTRYRKKEAPDGGWTERALRGSTAASVHDGRECGG